MRFRLPRRLLVVVLVALLVVLASSTVAWALSNGPETSSLNDGYGTSHSSTVYYDKETNPFVAEVDRVYYGGRKRDTDFGECCAIWTRYHTLYREWNGSSWVTVQSFGAGAWQSTGPESLSWWNLHNDVTLEGGALVQQRLEYEYHIVGPDGTVEIKWTGPYHNHYLE